MARTKNSHRKGRVLRRLFKLRAHVKPKEAPVDERIRELERFMLTAHERRYAMRRSGQLPPPDEHPAPGRARPRPARWCEKQAESHQRIGSWLLLGFFGVLAVVLGAWLLLRLATVGIVTL